jgi:hypothetical protein
VLAYEVIELTPPPAAMGPAGQVFAWDVNSNGEAAGGAHKHDRADQEPVLWMKPDAPQVIEPIPPGGWAGWGEAINDHDDVVGGTDWPNYDTNRKGGPSAFIFHNKRGSVQDLAQIVGGKVSLALDINDEGFVVGHAGERLVLEFPSAPAHGFIYDSKNDGLTEIDPPPGHVNASANAINNLGHVVGVFSGGVADSFWRLFIHREGQTDDLGLAYGYDINDTDVITGVRLVYSNQVPHTCAFRYDAAAANPSFEDLNGLPSGLINSTGVSINNDGVIVGWALAGTGPWPRNPHAVIYIPDGPDAGWTDLNDTLVNNDGWDLYHARGISNSGHIVGIGHHHGLRRAFLLRPHAPHLELVAQAIWVLITIIGGSTVGAPGGIGITGGGNPVPIDPQEFATVWRDLSAHERDTYIGVAIRNLGGIVADPETRAEVERVATRLMESGTREVGSG